MDLEAIEQRAELTNRIRATIAKIDAKPWRGTDEERQQFEAEAIMRAHVGPELDALVARVRELEEELDDTIEVRNAQLVEVNQQRNDLMARARGLEAENKRLREALQDMDARTTATSRREQAAQRARIAGW